MSDKKRQSNFELLRIVCMFLIIIYHVFYHCIDKQVSDPSLSASGTNFNDFIFHKRLVIIDLCSSLGKIGVVIFVMISGYFLIGKDFKVSKQVIKVLSQMFFITVVLIIATFIHLHFEKITVAQTIYIFNEKWWFPGLYLIVVIIAWIGLNKYIKGIEREKYFMILCAIFAVISINWCRDELAKIGIDKIMIGVFAYLLGGYIRLYNPMKNIKAIYIFFIMIFIIILMELSYYNYSINIINQAIEDNQESYSLVVHRFPEFSISCMVLGTSIFELFRRLKIKYSRLINYVASATFMIYLTHENDYVRDLYFKIDWAELLYNGHYLKMTLLILAIVVAVFICGIILYAIYDLIVKVFCKLFISNNKTSVKSE